MTVLAELSDDRVGALETQMGEEVSERWMFEQKLHSRLDHFVF